MYREQNIKIKTGNINIKYIKHMYIKKFKNITDMRLMLNMVKLVFQKLKKLNIFIDSLWISYCTILLEHVAKECYYWTQ